MNINEIAKRQLILSFDALAYLIDKTPLELWNEKKGAYIYWQQILHAITGSLFWLRSEKTEFLEPFSDLQVYPELEKDPENELSKDQLYALLAEAVELANHFFDSFDSHTLLEPSILYCKISNLDVVFGQIRHLQYHLGHCECILRECGITDLKWIDYMGE